MIMQPLYTCISLNKICKEKRRKKKEKYITNHLHYLNIYTLNIYLSTMDHWKQEIFSTQWKKQGITGHLIQF